MELEHLRVAVDIFLYFLGGCARRPGGAPLEHVPPCP
jgi:hypothetical protein